MSLLDLALSKGVLLATARNKRRMYGARVEYMQALGEVRNVVHEDMEQLFPLTAEAVENALIHGWRS